MPHLTQLRLTMASVENIVCGAWQVLDPIQGAAFALQSAPFAPDVLRLGAHLAVEAGLPAAEDILAYV